MPNIISQNITNMKLKPKIRKKIAEKCQFAKNIPYAIINELQAHHVDPTNELVASLLDDVHKLKLKKR